MTARSYLFVPANRREMLAKALTLGADALVIDLEDAVPESEKAEARDLVAEWLSTVTTNCEIWLRVNNRSDHLDADLALLETQALAGICLPKVESTHPLDSIAAPTIAMIESGSGLFAIHGIAAHPSVVLLACGEEDLKADLGIEPSYDERELLPFRMQIVAASAAAGIDPPVGPIATDYRDLKAFRLGTEALRRMGFGARPAIHPNQVAVINESFTPSEEAVQRASRILESYQMAGEGVLAGEDGTMIDEAVVRSARRVLAIHESIAGPS